MQANVEVLDRFLTEVAGTPAVLVGNSMGGMISILTAARTPESVSGLVLLDAAVPGPRGKPDPLVAASFAPVRDPDGRRARDARCAGCGQTPLRRVREMLQLCGVDPDAVPAEVIDRSVTLIEERRDVDGDGQGVPRRRPVAAAAARRPARATGAAMAAITAPVLMIQGDLDRLVPVTAARDVAARHPGWRYVELAGVGHVPQLQVPERAGRGGARLASASPAERRAS